MGFEQTAGTGHLQLAQAQPGRKSDVEVEPGSFRDAHRRSGLARGQIASLVRARIEEKNSIYFEEKDRHFRSDLTL